MAEPEIKTEVKTDATDTGVDVNPVEDTEKQTDTGNDELLKVKADYAKLKAALDKATKEAGDYRKQLKARMTAEENAAEEQRVADEATKKELEDLRRKVARVETVKAVMAKLGTDEETSGRLAEHLYGAENIEAALIEFQKAWAAKEKALRLEFGKIPAPGVGGADGEDAEEQKAMNFARKLGKERAGAGKTLAETLGSYVR